MIQTDANGNVILSIDDFINKQAQARAEGIIEAGATKTANKTTKSTSKASYDEIGRFEHKDFCLIAVQNSKTKKVTVNFDYPSESEAYRRWAQRPAPMWSTLVSSIVADVYQLNGIQAKKATQSELVEDLKEAKTVTQFIHSAHMINELSQKE